MLFLDPSLLEGGATVPLVVDIVVSFLGNTTNRKITDATP
jgi:hypothetical protein